MKFFIALFCILPLISGMSVDTTSSKCYVNYLKHKGFLGGEKGTPRVVTPECSAIVEHAIAGKVEEARQVMVESFESDQVECIITKLKKTDTFDRELIEDLDFSKAKVDEETIEESESLGVLTTTVNLIRAMVSCKVEEKFDDNFTKKMQRKFDTLFSRSAKPFTTMRIIA